jgi:uncharacterized membrane protein YdjX (TVP38/TMEM64 family)
MKKWFILIFYVILFLWGITNRDLFLTWIQENNHSYLFVFLFLSTLFATIPIIPFTLFGGLVGVKYGVTVGLMINWFGAFSASLLYYFFARFLLSENTSEKFTKYKKLEKFHSLIEGDTFMAILLFRLIPIIPPFIVHIYSGVSRIRLQTYLVATGIGLVPSMFILAFGGDQLFTNFPQFLLGLSLYLIFVLGIYLAYRLWIKSKVQVVRE